MSTSGGKTPRSEESMSFRQARYLNEYRDKLADARSELDRLREQLESAHDAVALIAQWRIAEKAELDRVRALGDALAAAVDAVDLDSTFNPPTATEIRRRIDAWRAGR